MKNIKWKENQSLLKEKISDLAFSRILVHSDSIKSLSFIDFEEDTSLNIQKHINFLLSLSDEMLFPSFNYDFPKNKNFFYDNFECQVGVIPEFFRKHNKCLRTFDPMFSISGTKLDKKFCEYKKKINSFKENGFFQTFRGNGNGILFYGADLSSAAIIHYVESIMEIPYRYEKEFKGKALIDGTLRELIFKSHFRPFKMNLDYDWRKIYKDLSDEKILFRINKFCHILDSQKLINFWSEKLNNDLLYLLDNNSVEWVEPKLDLLGRPFIASDFE